jgi:type II secretory pathway component GspD/PulD (secretin)
VGNPRPQDAKTRAAALRGLKGAMTFDFEATPLDTILTKMSQAYGVVIMQTQPMRQQATVRNPQPLDAQAGIILLNDMLYPIGYTTVVDVTPDGHVVLRILTLTEAKKLLIPVFKGADPDEVPDDDSLRTQIIPLNNVSALQLRNDLMPLMGGGETDVTSGAASNSLVITDTSAKIKRLLVIIQKLDNVKTVPLKLEYRQMQHTNAQDAAQLMNRLFAPPNTGEAQAPASKPASSANGWTAPTRLYADYDARTNTVILNGPPDQVAVALAILDRLDSQAADPPPQPAGEEPALNKTMKFNFEARPVDTILNKMSQEYGFAIIQTQRVTQAVTIKTAQPLDAKDGIILLNDMLCQIGYISVVDTTPEGYTVLRVMTLQEYRMAQIPVYYGADPEQIPLDDNLRTQIIPLQGIPAGVRDDIMPLLDPNADVKVNTPTNSLVITDTSIHIKRVVEIIQRLHNPKHPPLKLEYKPLQYTNARDAAKLINWLFAPTNAGEAQAPASKPAGSNTGGTVIGRMYADYDARTNTVILNGPPDQVTVALAILDRLASQAADPPPQPAGEEPVRIRRNEGQTSPKQP